MTLTRTSERAGSTRRQATLLAAGMIGLLGACTSLRGGVPVGTVPAGEGAGSPAAGLRLGYFADFTHATPIIGVEEGFYTRSLGSAKFCASVYTSGTQEMSDLLAGRLDAAYVGPSSALNAYIASYGRGLEVVAGAEDGGAEFVVAPDVHSAADLRGRTVADPQQGDTQDVALRYWLKQQNVDDVRIRNMDGAAALGEFRSGSIAGAWLTEPWASRLVAEGGGHVLVDERSLWPNGDFATAVLVVRSDYLQLHPQTVTRLIDGQLAADAWARANPQRAQNLVGARVAALTGTALSPGETARAWSEETATDDPAASNLPTEYDHAVADGLLDKGSAITGIFDLTPLDRELAAAGLVPAGADGLGSQ